MAKRLASKSGADKVALVQDPAMRRSKTVVCHGELLLRLSAPPGERLFQGSQLRCHVGGAEANVAVGLARLGHSPRMLSAVPDSPTGRVAVESLRRHGVDTQGVIEGTGRMGLYFLESAAAGRAGDVVYDRAGSVFATTVLPSLTIKAALNGADWIHSSGITPALGPAPRKGLHDLWRAAQTAGIPVSFDCNFRPSLWQGRLAQARRELSAGMSVARVAFADSRVLGLVLGEEIPRTDEVAAFTRLARKAFVRYPRLQQIAATSRTEHSASRHELQGFLATRDGVESSDRLVADPIVDRIGTGDAFAAALLLASLEGMASRQALSWAVAACVLKHSFPGDFNLATRVEVEALAAGRSGGIRR